MKRLGIMFLFCAVLLGRQLVAQTTLSTNYPFLYKVTLGTSVSHDVVNGFYYYNYTLTNDRNNKGDIFMFEIDILRHAGSVMYDTAGLKFYSRYDELLFRRHYPPSANAVESVGFPSLPSLKWDVSIANGSVANFGVDTLLPKPGSSVSGFAMMSKSLPAIRAFTVYPDFNVFNYYPDLDEDTTAAARATSHFVDSIRDVVNYHGWIIGPSAPPIDFNVFIWCDTLTSYTTQSRSLSWIKDQTTANKYLGYFSSARTKLVQRDSLGARTVLLQVLHDVDIDSTANLTSEAYALLRFNTEYLANLLPQSQSQTAPFYAVKLVSSTGTKLTGGSLQYYEGSWKDAVNNNDGTFSIASTAKTLSLRMTYEYGAQTKSNVSISNDTIVFQTVNAQIQLQNSNGVLLDTGSVQYYAGAWRILGTTINGTTNKELLPNSYSFRMSYAFASKDKQQDISTNPTVVFQTVNASVQLKNSLGNLIDQGTVQYYSGAWRTFGTTNNGTANKELLPNSYSFRMTYAFASKDKQQDISTNTTIVFQTVNAAVQLKNSLGNLIDQGTVQYYSGAWIDFGTTNNGTANKELLPNNYSFRMTYEFVSLDKSQDLSASSTVSFSTVLCTVRVSGVTGQLVDGALASYYSGAWRQIGSTVNGEVKKELLPANLTFRISYNNKQQDKVLNLLTSNVVQFVTP